MRKSRTEGCVDRAGTMVNPLELLIVLAVGRGNKTAGS
jgi:hypothetical protein